MKKWSPDLKKGVNRDFLWRDLLASIVVFLTALPLCMGIALASGAPIETGLLTGIIGGAIIGFLSGSPLQVSGPAAGLSILVLEMIQRHGFQSLGICLIAAGLIQMLAGLLRLGKLFRAVSPAVVHAMLAGIGISIFCSQILVMIDAKPLGSAGQNITGFLSILGTWVACPARIPAAAYLGLATISLVLLGKRLAPARFQIFPKELLAIVIVTACATMAKLTVQHVSLPANIFQHLNFSVQLSGQSMSLAQILQCALALALIASAETLLSANAVDRLHLGKRANYDKELFAQGVGNALCGMVGALPMTGVIARSSVNVHAGARTRASAILHGVWLLIAAACLPCVLSLVPVSCLAAILILTAVKLIDLEAAKQLFKYGVRVLAIYITTIVAIVSTDLLTGVMVGVVLSLAKLLYTMSRLDIQPVKDAHSNRVTLHLQGAATLVSLPKLAEALEQIPPACQLHIVMDDLDYLDHACFELIKDWEKQHHSAGGVAVIDGSELTTVLRLKSRRRLEHRFRAQHVNLAPAPGLDHVAASMAN